jgi:hypothetical protein
MTAAMCHCAPGRAASEGRLIARQRDCGGHCANPEHSNRSVLASCQAPWRRSRTWRGLARYHGQTSRKQGIERGLLLTTSSFEHDLERTSGSSQCSASRSRRTVGKRAHFRRPVDRHVQRRFAHVDSDTRMHDYKLRGSLRGSRDSLLARPYHASATLEQLFGPSQGDPLWDPRSVTIVRSGNNRSPTPALDTYDRKSRRDKVITLELNCLRPLRHLSV